MRINSVVPHQDFEAVQFLREHADLVAEWSDSSYTVYREREAERDVYILLWPLPDGGDMVVHETDWIIKDHEGFFVCTDEEFKQRYMIRSWREVKEI